jgi:hypothetical protein
MEIEFRNRNNSGADHVCPICRAALSIGPSEMISEAGCPRCLGKLWGIACASGTVFFIRRPEQSRDEFAISTMESLLAWPPGDFRAMLRSADSLDRVELLSEFVESICAFCAR